MKDITDLIKNYTKLQPVDFVPEIRLFTRDDPYFHELLMEEVNDEFVAWPEWVQVWSGGRALARYILDNPTLFTGKTVVDYCSGSGVAGIAAAVVGAKVTCVDIDLYSHQAIKLNAKANKVDVEVSADLVDADIILVACPSFKTLTGTFPKKQLDLIKAYNQSYLGYKVLRNEYEGGFFKSEDFDIIDRKIVPASISTEGRSTREVIIMSHLSHC